MGMMNPKAKVSRPKYFLLSDMHISKMAAKLNKVN